MLAAVVLVASPAMAADQDNASKAFIEDAGKGNLWEVQVGQLAEHKATNPDVRKFGATLNSDHGNATRQASLAAQALGVTPPATALDPKHQAKYDRLSKLSGDKFDSAFIDAMIKDHQEDIAKYEKQAAMGTDAASTYAKETLPRLREHLQMAQQLKQGGKSAANR
jgi:putative membrane protein